MISLRIPADHREVVTALSKLSAEQVQELERQLTDADSDIGDSRRALEAYVPTPAIALDALVGMATTVIGHGVDAQEVAQAVKQIIGDQPAATDLTPLLENRAIQRIAKHFDVGYSHERLVSNVRIFTEMRPIFDEPISSGFRVAVITHSIRITSYENGEPHELFFTLDHEDLQQMKDQVQRALEKESILSQTLQDAGMTLLNDSHGAQS